MQANSQIDLLYFLEECGIGSSRQTLLPHIPRAPDVALCVLLSPEVEGNHTGATPIQGVWWKAA